MSGAVPPLPVKLRGVHRVNFAYISTPTTRIQHCPLKVEYTLSINIVTVF